MAPAIIILVVCIIATLIFKAKVPGFKKVRKKFTYYILILIAIHAVFFIIVYNLKQSTLFIRFISLQLFLLVLGSVHISIYRKNFNSLEAKKNITEIIFAFLISGYLLLPLTFIIAYYNDFNYMYFFYFSSLSFIIPTFINFLYHYSVSIPAKLFKKWYYPLSKNYPRIKPNELTNIILLNFTFYKNEKERHLTSFKVKAPKNMDFGRLFYFFMNDYNEKFPNGKIEFTDNSGNPYGWYFYSKPRWYSSSRYIDFDLTVENNNLRDNMVVLCQRI